MATALSVDDICRLCLDPFVESYTTVENPAMKEQLEKVFCFPIEFKDGISSTVCQICANTVIEFCEYSDQVRQNQERLQTNLGSSGALLSAHIKIELDSDTDLPEPPVQNPIQRSPDNIDAYQSSSKVTRTKITPKNLSKDTESDIEAMIRRKWTQDSNDQFLLKHFKLTCDLCSAVSETFADLRSHFELAHQRQDGYAVCCGKKFALRRSIVEHVRFHLNASAFQCEHCQKGFETTKALKTHRIRVHGFDLKFKCQRCPRAYANQALLDAHMERHGKSECPECRKCYSSKEALDLHMKVHMPQDCPECKKTFLSKMTLRNHIYKKHSNRKFVCEQCGEHFTCTTSFKRHTDEHEGIEEPKTQCKICGRWMKAFHLKTHIESVHGSKERVHECDICHRKYSHPVKLQNHKSKAHIEAKYKCDFCDKLFRQKERLRDHMTTHTSVALHACEYCGMTYKTRATVGKHIKKKHPDKWMERRQHFLPNVEDSSSNDAVQEEVGST